MNMVRLAAALGIGILVSSAGFVACSSSDSSNPPPPVKDGSTDDKDTGTNPPPSDAGTLEAAPPDPKNIQCNGAACSSEDHNCCVQSNGTQSCNANSGAACTGAVEIHCDEKPDCNATQVCCADLNPTPALVSCKANTGCGGANQYQLCKTNAECDTGTCIAHKCPGLNFPVLACKPITGCTRCPASGCQ